MLAKHLAKPLFQLYEYGNVSMKNAAPVLKKYMEVQGTTKVQADEQALEFYLLNHCFGVLRSKYSDLEELPPAVEDLAGMYVDRASKMALRAYYYLYIICSREARHYNNNSTKVLSTITTQMGKGVYNVISHIANGNSDTVYSLLTQGEDMQVGDLVRALQIVFYKGGWGSAYGGPAWGKITDCLCMLLEGKTTPEMMLDTIWTLAHNNGPIFNKPYLYSGYTPELKTILDVQRSGQIPQLLNDYRNGVVHFNSEALKAVVPLYEKIVSLVDWVDLKGYVDWYKVEALGSVASYHGYKTKQKAKYGASPYDKKKMVVKGASGKVYVDFAADKGGGATPSVKEGVYTIGNIDYKKLAREDL